MNSFVKNPTGIGPELAAQIMSPEYGYLDRGNPAVFNEFSTAAFRLGHSQLRSLVGYVSSLLDAKSFIKCTTNISLL